MIDELGRYKFEKMSATNHYEPKHWLHNFYMKERKRVYEHRPFRDEELFRNVGTKVEVNKIHAKMQEEAPKQQREVEASIHKKLSQSWGRRSQESTSRVTQFPPMIQEPIGQYASMHGKVLIELVAQQVRETVDENFQDPSKN